MIEITRSVKEGKRKLLELQDGNRIERLGPSTEDAYCVVWATIPPDGGAPSHSYTDAESFYVLSEEAEALVETAGGLEWQKLKPAVWEMGQIMSEAGRQIPSQARIQRLVEIFKRYGYWLGSSEENAALGIELA